MIPLFQWQMNLQTEKNKLNEQKIAIYILSISRYIDCGDNISIKLLFTIPFIFLNKHFSELNLLLSLICLDLSILISSTRESR